MSTSAASSSTSPEPSAARRIVASVLSVGGAAAFGASFLPFWQAAYPATDIASAGAYIHVPTAELIAIVQNNLSYPESASFGGTAFLAFMTWGAPLILVALGTVALLKRRWTPGISARILALLLTLLGLGFTILLCWGYMNPIFGSQGATRSLSIGAFVTIAGYIIALAGVIALPATVTRTRG